MTRRIIAVPLVGCILMVLLGCAPCTTFVDIFQKRFQQGLEQAKPKPKPAEETYPATPEDVIRAFYKAVSDHDYEKAATYAGGAFTVDFIKAQFEPHIRSVEVAEIIRYQQGDNPGQQCYQVNFKADYIKHYEAGSGDLPMFHWLQQDAQGHWKVVGIATGP